MNLVDNPSERKTHSHPVPLIGGIAIILASGMALIIYPEFWIYIGQYNALVVGSLLLLLIGVIDDKMDVRPILRLIIQIAIAHFVFDSGIRIDSMYGVFGVYELPVIAQYFLTMLVIVGTINAFNLMDGIDGLAAGLAIIGLLAYSYIAILAHKEFLVVLFVSLIGALIAFLRYNLSKKNKIFMGDAGSLVLGFILVVSGIILLQSTKGTSNISVSLAVVISVLALPVADSLRVYRKRIKQGYSPFRADRTHLHHMVLFLGVKHKVACALILFLSLGIIGLSIVFGSTFNITFIIISILALFIVISTILGANRELNLWVNKIRKLEKLN